MTHEVGDYGLKRDLEREAHITQELAGLVIQGRGASEDDMAAPEPVLSGVQFADIVKASAAIPEEAENDELRHPVIGSRRHWGSGPDGRGPSLGDLKARTQVPDPFSVGVRRAAYNRRIAGNL